MMGGTIRRQVPADKNIDDDTGSSCILGLGPRVGGRQALFYIHRMNRVYGALIVTSWTCYGALYIVVSLLLLLLLLLLLSSLADSYGLSR